MGLDLYAGPLTRYYSGNWQTEMQQLGAQVIYADGAAPWISPEEAKRKVEQFHADLAARLAAYEYVLPQWQETADHAYATVKPSHEGREALLLWAAYILRRDLKRPKTLPADITTADFALAHESPLGAKKLVSSTSELEFEHR